MLGLEELSEQDRRTVATARRLERFLTQPFFTTEHFNRAARGRLVPLEEAARTGSAPHPGRRKGRDRPEGDFYMIGGLDDLPARDGGGERNGKNGPNREAGADGTSADDADRGAA